MPTPLCSDVAASSAPPRPKILVVDDSVGVRSLAERALTGAGYEVILAGDGDEALAQFAAHPNIVCMFCDVHMPNLDGMAVLERMAPRSTHVKCVMVTTEASPEIIARGRTLGASGWVVKPFTAAGLVALADRLVAAAAKGR